MIKPMTSSSLMTRLPIADYQRQITDAIKEHPFLLVVGETGSGKTTQIPQYILRDLPDLKRVAISQPRRVAAVTVAQRVAEELNSKLGGSEVGFKIRFEDCSQPDTRLTFMTDGILLRECREDPLLKSYDVVILDEAHERSLETDVLFGLLKRSHGIRPGLRIIIMSATLNIEKFSKFFGDCPVFEIPGRVYDVEILHQRKASLSSLKGTYVQKCIETVLHIHRTEGPGDVLVFLTGQQEIEYACKTLSELDRQLYYREDVAYHEEIRGLVIFPIYASLETFEQRSVFRPPPAGHRKVVFSTNIAATSVTIDGIKFVVDSGFVKQKMYDPTINMDALLVVPISKSAADQRAGRAGRTSHGKCFRLYSADDYYGMEDETEPEICRTSLASTVLQLKKMNINDIIRFPLMDPPDPSLLYSAATQLYFLEALDMNGRITKLGELIAVFPLAPNLARAVIASAEKYKCSREMVTIAALLSSEDIYQNPRNSEKAREAAKIHELWKHSSGDHLTLLNIFTVFRSLEENEQRDWAKYNYLNWRALKHAREVERQLLDIMRRFNLEIVGAPSISRDDVKDKRHWGDPDNYISHIDPRPILKSLLSAFYTNMARKHTTRPMFYHYASTAAHSTLSLEDTAEHGHPESHIEHQTHTSTNPYLLALSVHPQSALNRYSKSKSHDRRPGERSEDEVRFVLKDGVEWVIYHDLMYTKQAYMRCCSKVVYDWIDEVGVRQLLESKRSGKAIGMRLVTEIDETEESKEKSAEQHEKTEGTSDSKEMETMDNAESEEQRAKNAEEAKQRFLERKRQRELQASQTTQKRRR